MQGVCLCACAGGCYVSEKEIDVHVLLVVFLIHV